MDLIFQREDKTQSYNSNSAYWEPFNKEYPNKEPFFKEYATKPDFPFQIKDPAFQKTTLPFLNNPQNLENQQYLSQNKWKPNFYLQYNNSNKNINQEMLNAKSSASLRNSKINQINFSQNEMVSNYNNNESFSFRFLFKDLFPTNFEHSKFPIFSLFIQRIPNHDILEEVWYYKDPQGEIQGPFNSNDMDNWNNDGYFSLELEIGWNQNKVFVMIENFIQNPCILIDLSLKHANLTKYFRNILNSGQFLEFKKQNAAKNVNSLSFNNYATSIISKNYNISKNNQEKISTESLKCLLGIQPALSLNFVEKKGMV